MTTRWDNFWKDGWERTRERHIAWWRGEGLVLHVMAPRGGTAYDADAQAPFYYLMSGLDADAAFDGPDALAAHWLDAVPRARRAARYLADIYFGGEAFPYFDTHTGPGSLATYLGATPEFAPDTVWFWPARTALSASTPLRFDPGNPWFLRQKALLEAGMDVSAGRFLVSMPDLVENIDTLAALRDTQVFMLDLVERPDFVKAKVAEINQVYFAAFAAFFDIIKDPWGGNAFSAFHIWGPGKTAKVQCDAAAMISPAMFAEFVAPGLTEQCAWLDYAIYHLDGTHALPHLDTLLHIDALDAIEWTPQVGQPQGGDPAWYAMYRRILDVGKSVQAINVQPAEVIPLLDAVGPKGMFVTVTAATEAEARALEEAVEAYHQA